MALHFLTILFQTGEFLRLQQAQQEAQNSSFPPYSTHRPKSGFPVSLSSKPDFESGGYDLPDEYDNANMTLDGSLYREWNISSDVHSGDSADVADWLVFMTLEILGVSGFVGNLALLMVIISSGLLERPSFIFIASLAVADIFHSLVTSCYFYPPIILRTHVFNRLGVQFMNALDWTAWGITLTHMMAICVDRLLAIVLFQDYARLVTVSKTITVSLICWCCFAGVNTLFTALQLCCVVVPQPEFYTFGFEDPSTSILLYDQLGVNSTAPRSNAYKPLYVPLECLAMLILAIGNPIILFNLYQKYRRKRTLRAASVVLVEVGQSLCRQTLSMDASLARDIKIFLQIIVVTIIFFAYMFIYYLFFYITEFSDKWSTMLNSICYSITHMINPVVYFSLNEQMQKQMKNIINNIGFVKRRKAAKIGRRNALCGIPAIVHAMTLASAALSETSPLMRMSFMDREDSVGQHSTVSNSGTLLDGRRDSRAPQITSVIPEEQDYEMECDEMLSIRTPLLNGGHKMLSTSYMVDGQTKNGECRIASKSFEFDTVVYDVNLVESCDDVFV